jgi:hypothetical protein
MQHTTSPESERGLHCRTCQAAQVADAASWSGSGRPAVGAGATGCRMAVIGTAPGLRVGGPNDAPGCLPLAAAGVVRVRVA